MGYDGMRQPITPVLRERWVYTAFCGVVLVLDRTQSPFKTTKTTTTTAAATVEARLASPLCFPPRRCSTSNVDAAAVVCVPYLHPIFRTPVSRPNVSIPRKPKRE